MSDISENCGLLDASLVEKLGSAEILRHSYMSLLMQISPVNFLCLI